MKKYVKIAQSDHLVKLRAEVTRLNKEDPSMQKTIKYISGIPSIVDAATVDSPKNLPQPFPTQDTASIIRM